MVQIVNLHDDRPFEWLDKNYVISSIDGVSIRREVGFVDCGVVINLKKGEDFFCCLSTRLG